MSISQDKPQIAVGRLLAVAGICGGRLLVVWAFQIQAVENHGHSLISQAWKSTT